jgi:hypothetical protein
VYSPIIGWSEAKFEDGICASLTHPYYHETESNQTTITLQKGNELQTYEMGQFWSEKWKMEEIDDEGNPTNKLIDSPPKKPDKTIR